MLWTFHRRNSGPKQQLESRHCRHYSKPLSPCDSTCLLVSKLTFFYKHTIPLELDHDKLAPPRRRRQSNMSSWHRDLARLCPPVSWGASRGHRPWLLASTASPPSSHSGRIQVLVVHVRLPYMSQHTHLTSTAPLDHKWHFCPLPLLQSGHAPSLDSWTCLTPRKRPSDATPYR